MKMIKMRLKKNILKRTLAYLFYFALVLFVMLGLPIITNDVIGANNLTTTTKVWVWNTEPNLYNVEVIGAPISLIAGNTTSVNCTGYVWDYNGWQDINVTNATFYDSRVSSDGDANDNNYHYTLNATKDCNCTQLGSASTNATCSCYFYVWYYANNGTNWLCNMTVSDSAGNATERKLVFNSTRNSSVVTINQVVGIDVPAQIDYGNLSVTETSENKTANVTNYGNVPINISVRGWGGDNSSIWNAGNYSMFCDYGNISISAEKWSVDVNDGYSTMHKLNDSIMQMNLTLPARTNDTHLENSTNATYWRIQIPLTVGGSCNGTIEFSAISAS